jgi:hypothetical protein
MDMKSVFLNGCINELVYVEQPRTWYKRLRDFLLSKGFVMGKVDTTLFTKKIEKDLFALQIYVDDIIFGSTNQDFCELEKMMVNEFEMSMIRELSYFLGLQIKQMKNGTFMSQGKYIKDMLKKFGMEHAKRISIPIGTNRS